MATVTVPMDDQALFAAATSDDKPAEVQAEAPQETAPEAPQDDGQPRDERGRFATKAEPEQAQQPPQEQPQTTEQPSQVPTWRLNEIAAERREAMARAEAAERRAQDIERQYRQTQEQLRKFTEKPAEPIDPFADPQRFRDEGVQQAIAPLMQQLASQREYFSRKAAIAEHGLDTVKEAFSWLQQGANAGDPRLAQLLQRVTNSVDPFDDLVTAYKREKAAEMVGNDPDAWFEKQVAESAKDPAKRQKLMAMLNGEPSQSAPRNVVQLPPSLNKSGGGSSVPMVNGGMDDTSLFAHAMGRT